MTTSYDTDDGDGGTRTVASVETFGAIVIAAVIFTAGMLAGALIFG